MITIHRRRIRTQRMLTLRSVSRIIRSVRRFHLAAAAVRTSQKNRRNHRISRHRCKWSMECPSRIHTISIWIHWSKFIHAALHIHLPDDFITIAFIHFSVTYSIRLAAVWKRAVPVPKVNTAADRVLHGTRTISISAMWRSRQVAVATNSTPTIQNTTTTPKGMATRTTTNTVAVAVAAAAANTTGPANTTTGNAARLDRTCMPVDHRIDRRKFRAVHRIRNDNRNRKRSRSSSSSSSAHRNGSASTVETYSVTSRRHRPNINSNARCWVFVVVVVSCSIEFSSVHWAKLEFRETTLCVELLLKLE